MIIVIAATTEMNRDASISPKCRVKVQGVLVGVWLVTQGAGLLVVGSGLYARFLKDQRLLLTRQVGKPVALLASPTRT